MFDIAIDDLSYHDRYDAVDGFKNIFDFFAVHPEERQEFLDERGWRVGKGFGWSAEKKWKAPGYSSALLWVVSFVGICLFRLFRPSFLAGAAFGCHVAFGENLQLGTEKDSREYGAQDVADGTSHPYAGESVHLPVGDNIRNDIDERGEEKYLA